MQIVTGIGMCQKNQRIIEHLYWNQAAVLRADEDMKAAKILRGVSQEYILSYILFNLYLQLIFRKALEVIEKVIPINGHRINNSVMQMTIMSIMIFRLFYTKISTYEGFKVGVRDFMWDFKWEWVFFSVVVSGKYGREINTSKSKYMVISKGCITTAHLFINRMKIHRNPANPN